MSIEIPLLGKVVDSCGKTVGDVSEAWVAWVEVGRLGEEVADASVKVEVWLTSGGTADSVEIGLLWEVTVSRGKFVVWTVSLG